MRLAVLFSGGKDSCLASHIAAEHEEVACLVTVVPDNPESYMFHTPNLDLVPLQAEALGLPLVWRTTPGVEEEELRDLRAALKEAMRAYDVEGVVTGAVASIYQATRVQRIADELGLWCFNPLWQRDQLDLLGELTRNGYEVIVTGVFAHPLDADWLGRSMDGEMISELARLEEQWGINPAGEGGELETTVLDAPMFRRRVEVIAVTSTFSRDSGMLHIQEARLVAK